MIPIPNLLDHFGMRPFEQRFPWIGGDLQTLRDTFRNESLPKDRGKVVEIPIPGLLSGGAGSGHLLAFLDLPEKCSCPRGLVLMLHGLGGSSRRLGLRRMAVSFIEAGFAVLRLNLRGADPGRHLAGGTYAAKCNSDLIPVLVRARELCDELGTQCNCSNGALPLLGAGISLGGTMLLNACLDIRSPLISAGLVLDGLVCTSSPLDLAACSASIERPRNRLYQRWLLDRLVRQTLADPFGVTSQEKESLSGALQGITPIRSIRQFDSVITAPRWGYPDVDSYYSEASPLFALLKGPSELPPTLILQARDDPWVPASGAQKLADSFPWSKDSILQVILPSHGGHNGFHGIAGCWGDQLAERWFTYLGF